MLKLKILALLFFLGFVGFVLDGSRQFQARAADDSIMTEIAAYKTWNRITAEPIRVGMDAAVFG